MRDADLLFHLKVDDPRDLSQLAAKLLGKAADAVEILAEDLERDLGAYAESMWSRRCEIG